MSGMPFSVKKRLRFWLPMAVAAVVFLGLSGYVAAHLYIKNVGIFLHPNGDVEPRKIVFHLQNDPRWSSERIGRSGSTMGGAGCLLACIASTMTALGIPDTTPDRLNARLTQEDGFSGDRLIWNRISAAVPEADYAYSRIFGAGRIHRDLERGLLPIVNVRYFRTGITHWIVIVGAQNGEFLCMDPADRSRTPQPLSRHGKVYAYRVILRR